MPLVNPLTEVSLAFIICVRLSLTSPTETLSHQHNSRNNSIGRQLTINPTVLDVVENLVVDMRIVEKGF
jgi:hypothetical protein